MSRLLITAGTVALLIPAAASAADERHHFTRDGVTYHYTVQQQPDRQIITGTNSSTGRFRLVVRNGRVAGVIGRTPVSFTLDEAAADARTQVALR